MIPIILSPNKEFHEENFREYLLSVCKDHKENNRALAFAFIVYDFEDHTIQEILEKKKYWSTLDKISGNLLTIFYIDSKDSYYERRQQEIYKEQTRQKLDITRLGIAQFLRPIILESTPLEETIKFFKKEFGLDTNIKHPFVLFFQTDGENIIDYFVVVLKQEELQNAFLELKNQINNAVSSVSKVSPDKSQNHQEIFDLIRSHVEGGNFWEFLNKKIVSKIGISSIISLVKTIAGYN